MKETVVPAKNLDKEHLEILLHSKLCQIFDQIKKERRIEILGNLDFEIVENIDNKKQRIAKLKGNTILVKLNSVKLPEEALRYIVAHEIVHTFTTRHTEQFWKIVETIYPNYEKGLKLLTKHGKFLNDFY